MAPANLKQAPCGQDAFVDIRRQNFAYVDKTQFIETLENLGVTKPFVVRPRRFGKTLFTSTLAAYYDIAAAKDFTKNFAGTYIAAHKTPLANQFYVLKLEFAGLSACDPLEQGFLNNVLSDLNVFFSTYPHPRQEEILSGKFSSAADLIKRFFSILGPDYRKKLYVIIDEYDQFANEILSSDLNKFKAITTANGFLKDFYSKIKSAAGDGGPIARLFITGVTSIPLDSMTSGFSCANNISDLPQIAAMFGFEESELRRLIPQIIDLDKYGHSLDDVLLRMKTLYNGYRFSPDSEVSVFNASMCLYYLSEIAFRGKEPANVLDPSSAPDISKIEGILSLGDPDFVKSVVEKALRGEKIPFDIGTLQLLNLNRQASFDDDQVLSALFYLGFLTYAPDDAYAFVVPNRAIRIQFFEYFMKNVLQTPSWKYVPKAYQEAYAALAEGDPVPFFNVSCNRFKARSGVHTHLHLTESDFQTWLLGSFGFTDAFNAEQEVEVRGLVSGNIDLLVQPTPGSRGKTSFLIEFKHLTKAEGTKIAIQKALEKAMAQAKAYASGDNIRTIPRLKLVAAVFVGLELKALEISE